ncbi:MAG: tyrosine-type recombinase/integrase, partial [Spirochaetota bacterium]
KEISGDISEVAIKAIKKAGLDSKKPFAGMGEEVVRNAFKYSTGKLFRAGKIEAAYSVHDLRHYFAIRVYMKDKDIYRLKTLLGHASIGVTENYLRGVERYWG